MDLENNPPTDNWNTDDEDVSATQNIKNVKGTKYGDKLIDEYNKKQSFTMDEKFIKSLSTSRYDAGYLKKLFKLMKTTKADVVELASGQNTPLIAEFLTNDDESKGMFLLAPKINHDSPTRDVVYKRQAKALAQKINNLHDEAQQEILKTFNDELETEVTE